MKKLLTWMGVVLLLSAGCTRSDEPGSDNQSGTLKQKKNTVAVPQGDPLSQRDLDRVVIGTLESRNDFQWEWMDLKTLWSALQYNDHSLAIGYKPADAGDISARLHKVQVRSGAYKQVHDELIAFL